MFGTGQNPFASDWAINPGLFPGAGDAGIRLRGLNEGDWQQHADHLQRLSPEGRRARFQSAISDAAIRSYVRGMDWRHVFVFGVFVHGTLRAVGELIPMTDLGSAEISVSVEDDHQHSGFGKMLVLAMFLAARHLGMHRLHIICSRDNDRMRALARDVGAHGRHVEGMLEFVVTLPPPGETARPGPPLPDMRPVG